MKIRKLHDSSGFTLIELMIALSILTTILLVGTMVITQVGGLYNKGINAANLQSATRNVVSDLSSTLQFNGSNPVLPAYNGTGDNAVCFGTTRYSYVLNRELGHDSSNGVDTPHVLWRDTMTAAGTCPPPSLASATPSDALSNGDGYEMMPQHGRLTHFTVAETPASSKIYAISVWTAYGDSDLVVTDATGKPSCKGSKGTEFCAISILNATVVRRIN